MDNFQLLQFSVKNYRSINDTVVLSMLADENSKRYFLSEDTGENIIRRAVIYGANASGKSTIIRAFFLVAQRLFKKELNLASPEKSVPFAFDESCKTKGSEFELCFSIGKTNYELGFTLRQKGSDEEILEEWLNYSTKERPTPKYIYRRSSQAVTINPNLKTSFHHLKRSYIDQVRKDELFIVSMSSLETSNLLGEILECLRSNVEAYNTIYTDELTNNVLSYIYENDYAAKSVLDFMKKAGTRIVNIERELAIPITQGKDKRYSAKFVYKVGERKVSLGQIDESTGNWKLFLYALPIINALKQGGTLLLDELESSLHPTLTKYILELFDSPETNPKNAQIITTSHDTSLMKDGFLGYDEIFFTSKSQQMETELFALSDIRGVRKNLMNLDDHYLRGIFEAIPDIVTSGDD